MMQQFDVAVIGGGLAGMSAALASARHGRSVAIVTGGVPGGELLNIERIDGIPGFPDGVPGYDLCPITQEMADAAGVVFIMEEATELAARDGGWRIVHGAGDLVARAVVIATGAHVASLDVPGEAEFVGRGVSHCATCDGPLLRGKDVVIAGGGDSGMQEALVLAQHVAQVVLVERGSELTGQKVYRDEVAAHPKIQVVTRTEVVAIKGDAAVNAITLRSLADGSERDLPASGIFSFIGLVPNSGPAVGVVETDSTGRIVVDAGLRASVPGICAAGNVRSGNSWRAAGAMGDGSTTAATLEEYLTAGVWIAA